MILLRLNTMALGTRGIHSCGAVREDEDKDIRRYCDETYEMYGIKFVSENEKSE